MDIIYEILHSINYRIIIINEYILVYAEFKIILSECIYRTQNNNIRHCAYSALHCWDKKYHDYQQEILTITTS